jgi:ABC-2 type transport system ATP-binding protein
MAEAFLVAQDLHKSFNDQKAVNGVSFTIQKNEIFGLLGPNGAGKTTSIRMLATVLEPDSGDVTIGGSSILRNWLFTKTSRRWIIWCSSAGWWD